MKNLYVCLHARQYPKFESDPGFDIFLDVIFIWNMRNLVILIPVYILLFFLKSGIRLYPGLWNQDVQHIKKQEVGHAKAIVHM